MVLVAGHHIGARAFSSLAAPLFDCADPIADAVEKLKPVFKHEKNPPNFCVVCVFGQ
jgi:hypothetical protein